PLRGKDLDRYLVDYAVINERLGADPADIPRTREEVKDYFAMMRPRLTVSEETLQAVRFLRGAYGNDPAARIGSQIISRVATDLLPPWAKRLLGLHPRTPITPVVARAAGI